ncbi:MAG: adenosylcobalamin-dependent ribonucleoside-diphosphate reductase [Pseudomonadales bacterium]
MRSAIARRIWETCYRFRRHDVPVDADPAATWERVARAAAAAERHDRGRWRRRFTALMADGEFYPGGRILAGAGTGRRVTLFNCFVLGRLQDDMAAIFDALKEAAMTLQAGGGVGCDFSPLRPGQTPAQATGNTASGPVSFMRLWDLMSDTVVAGSRRGAMMATLRCDHPDIVRFIRAKADRRALKHFNCSVLVSDAFLQAVAGDAPWPLTFGNQVLHTVAARELWNLITRNAYDNSEPGVLFVDRINAENNLYYRETLSATNPCGEVPLPPYGACNLGSFNLTAFVREPFTPNARFDHVALAERVPVAVRLLDDVVTVSGFPLPEQRAEALATRRIGLGFMGLGSALVMLGLDYDSDAGRALAADVAATLRDSAYAASIDLAAELGPCPAYHRRRYSKGAFVGRLPAPLLTRLRRHGIRNSHLTAIAPTGTISLLADNVSSGIEPVFQADYERRLSEPGGRRRTVRLTDYACLTWRQHRSGDAGLPPALQTARELSPEAHLKMQAAVQPFVDQAISKTINVPEHLPFEQFQDIYRQAHALGLKGVTVFRPRPDRPGILGGEPPAQRTGSGSGSTAL